MVVRLAQKEQSEQTPATAVLKRKEIPAWSRRCEPGAVCSSEVGATRSFSHQKYARAHALHEVFSMVARRVRCAYGEARICTMELPGVRGGLAEGGEGYLELPLQADHATAGEVDAARADGSLGAIRGVIVRRDRAPWVYHAGWEKSDCWALFGRDSCRDF